MGAPRRGAGDVALSRCLSLPGDSADDTHVGFDAVNGSPTAGMKCATGASWAVGAGTAPPLRGRAGSWAADGGSTAKSAATSWCRGNARASDANSCTAAVGTYTADEDAISSAMAASCAAGLCSGYSQRCAAASIARGPVGTSASCVSGRPCAAAMLGSGDRIAEEGREKRVSSAAAFVHALVRGAAVSRSGGSTGGSLSMSLCD